MSSISFFDTSAQADESTRVVASWLREEKLENVIPNPPKITGGEVIVHKMERTRSRRKRLVSTQGEGPRLAGLLPAREASDEDDHDNRVRSASRLLP